MTVVTQILDQMPSIAKPQCKFLMTLFATILSLRGRVNFRNLARYSSYSERTLSRQFRRDFDFNCFNRLAVQQVTTAETTLLFAQDASFIPKSGKQTYGLDRFWNGCTHRTEKGLEVSTIALLDVARNTGYALSVEQTPPRLTTPETTQPAAKPLTPNDKKIKSKVPPATPETDETRIDFYLQHLTATRTHLPTQVTYGVFDGAFAKRKFINGVCALSLHAISRLRCDADLRFHYTGEQKRRGRRKQYDGKVNFQDLRRFAPLGEVEPHITLYTAVVNSVSLRRDIRVVVLVNRTKPQKPRYVVLFATDCELTAQTIYEYYTARFQIEFLFRDAKQFAGLSDCQARDAQALHFHFNVALATVNVAKIEELKQQREPQPHVFSLASWKQRAFNEHLLDVIITELALEPTWVKNHPQYEYLRTYGAIAA